MKQKLIAGLKFNLLTTQYPIMDNPDSIRRKKWMCKCECGQQKIVRSWDLRNNIVKSCGCSRITNLIGKKFGKLIVLKRTENDARRGDIQWLCKCECGEEKIVLAYRLLSGTVKSCGCSKERKKYQEIYGTYFYRISHSAKLRGISSDITIEQIWNLFLKQNRKCALSGLPIKFSSKSDISDGTASLDRIDSSKGYTINNVQWVHKDINYMKQDNSDSDFIKYCCLVADLARKKNTSSQDA